jgi:hypothetical protein
MARGEPPEIVLLSTVSAGLECGLVLGWLPMLICVFLAMDAGPFAHDPMAGNGMIQTAASFARFAKTIFYLVHPQEDVAGPRDWWHQDPDSRSMPWWGVRFGRPRNKEGTGLVPSLERLLYLVLRFG